MLSKFVVTTKQKETNNKKDQSICWYFPDTYILYMAMFVSGSQRPATRDPQPLFVSLSQVYATKRGDMSQRPAFENLRRCDFLVTW